MRSLQELIGGVLIVLFATPAFGQTAGTPNTKLTDIEGEIASLEKQRSTGMYMAIGGTAASLLSLALVPSADVNDDLSVDQGSWVPFYLVLGAGTIVGIMGAYKWHNASQDLGPLKAKKYDLSFTPTWDIKRKDVGVVLALRF